MKITQKIAGARTFWISLIVVFTIISLSRLGFRPPEFGNMFKESMIGIVSPVDKSDIWDTVVEKLKQKQNNFQLKTTQSLITPALAVSDYENAKAYAAMDYNSGKLVSSHNLDQKTPIASLTKIMTAVVTLDLAAPDEVFTISEKSVSEIPTKLGMIEGQQMRVDELLGGLLLTSANDCAQVLKEGVDSKYQENVFIKAMNEKARIIGLNSTHFDNPQGFDSRNNYSTPGDLLILTRYALENYPLIAQIVRQDYKFLPPDDNHKQFDLYNWNGLLGVYPGVEGVKIGNTNEAMYTTIVVSQREGRKILAVLLGATGVLERDLWTAQLLDFSFQQIADLPEVNLDKEVLLAKYNTWKYWN